MPPIARQELGDLRQQRRIEGLVRRIPILGLAPNRYRTLHAQGGEDELLQVRSLILAIAIGHLEGEVLLLGKLVIAPDTAGGRSKVHIAALQAKPRGRPDRTGREELHGADVVEAIEDTAHGIIVKGVRRDSLAQEQFGVLMGKALFQALQRAAATQRIQHKAQYDRARVHVHLRGHIVIDEADEAQLVGVGFENGQMLDGVDLDLGQ